MISHLSLLVPPRRSDGLFDGDVPLTQSADSIRWNKKDVLRPDFPWSARSFRVGGVLRNFSKVSATTMPISESEKMARTEEEKETAPWSARILGSVLNFLDPWIYRKDGTVNRKLQSLLDPKVPASSKPVDGICSEDVVIDSTDNVCVRVFKPSLQENETNGEGKTKQRGTEDSGNSEKKLPVIIYYHGGGFVGLSAALTQYDKLCRQIAKSCSAVVLSLEYRRAPEYPYPAAYDDCYKVFEWLRSPESRTDHLPPGADISQCFLVGDSAGGNIVHFMGCRTAEDDISPVKILGMVELQPFFGGEELTPSEINLKPAILPLATTHWAWRAFLPGENRDHPACNVFGPNSPDISHLSLPPILVLIGSLDILQDRQAKYVEKLEEMGKDVTVKKYPAGYHAFYMVGNQDLSDKAMADVYDFILSRTIP